MCAERIDSVSKRVVDQVDLRWLSGSEVQERDRHLKSFNGVTHILNRFPLNLIWPTPGAKIKFLGLYSCKYRHQTNVSTKIFRYMLKSKF